VRERGWEGKGTGGGKGEGGGREELGRERGGDVAGKRERVMV